MKVAILGYGLEGESLTKYCLARGDEVTVFYYTNKSVPSSAPINHLPDGVDKINVGSQNGFSGLDFKGYHRVYRTSNVLPTKLKPVPWAKLCSLTQEFFDHCPAPIIGVTGTKGKGTTSSLIATILKQAGKKVWLVGNIGLPALDVLGKIKPQDYVVFELSSFQLQDLKKSPQIAVMLMIAEDHLDVHADMNEYITAKRQIFANQQPDDLAVYNQDNPISQAAVALSPAKIKLPVSNQVYLPNGVSVREGAIWFCAEPVIDLADIPLLGDHNQHNVASAVAATWSLVEDKSVFSKAIKSFKPLAHRLEQVAIKHGVRYIDDSIATNPSTVMAALDAIEGAVYLILGGSDKGHDFSELSTHIKKRNVAQVYILGQMQDKIGRSLVRAGFHRFDKVADMKTAVMTASRSAQSGGTVLLSPGCASFDMYSSYSERGKAFVEAVNQVK